MNYYNENDPKAAEWLRELIQHDHIPSGKVDERSITEVQPNDLNGFTQCHFFAGIGGWAFALRLAGWPDDVPVWTGSCPCQPFSVAGKQKGEADEQHLWPVWRALITERIPPVTFGEQVASKAGRLWLNGVRTDLETMGYALGAADLCAAGLGAPHIRQRLFWVADREQSGRQRGLYGRANQESQDQYRHAGFGSTVSGLALTNGGDSSNGEEQRGRQQRQQQKNSIVSPDWSRFDLIPCRDGKTRRVESGTFPLANGIPNRVGLLRGYGNAIVPKLAAEFIQAYLET